MIYMADSQFVWICGVALHPDGIVAIAKWIPSAPTIFLDTPAILVIDPEDISTSL